MDAHLRVVVQMPVRELWREDGFSTSTRKKSLSFHDIREFLASGTVQFVIADVGVALRWIPEGECFDFWKHEARLHLASDTKAALNEFPGGYCYFASQWEGETTAPLVLLEKSH